MIPPPYYTVRRKLNKQQDPGFSYYIIKTAMKMVLSIFLLLACYVALVPSVHGASCKKADGFIANEEACTCGITGCNSLTGLFCLASSNKCASSFVNNNDRSILELELALVSFNNTHSGYLADFAILKIPDNPADINSTTQRKLILLKKFKQTADAFDSKRKLVARTIDHILANVMEKKKKDVLANPGRKYSDNTNRRKLQADCTNIDGKQLNLFSGMQQNTCKCSNTDCACVDGTALQIKTTSSISDTQSTSSWKKFREQVLTTDLKFLDATVRWKDQGWVSFSRETCSYMYVI